MLPGELVILGIIWIAISIIIFYSYVDYRDELTYWYDEVTYGIDDEIDY